MILHYGSYASSVCGELADELGLGVGFVPPQERSHGAMLRRVSESRMCRFVDFQWYRDPTVEPSWIQETYGSRASLRASTAQRTNFLRAVASEFPDGPLFGLSGNVNDGRRSREYARELVLLKDAEYPTRRVIASFVVDRQGLSDNSVLADLNPLPRGVDGVSLAVQDVATYPSVWTYDDWYGWLRLIRSFVEAGYDVILPYSDVRGLVGVGVGALGLGTGPQQDLRQLRPAQDRQQSRGAQPSVSYVSIPLLSIVHGARAALEQEWSEVESHADSSTVLGAMNTLHPVGSTFDPRWTATGLPQGELTDNRIRQHVRALAAAESAILQSSSRADDVEAALEHAVSLGTRVSQDIFKNRGGQGELSSRLNAFRSVRSDLSF